MPRQWSFCACFGATAKISTGPGFGATVAGFTTGFMFDFAKVSICNSFCSDGGDILAVDGCVFFEHKATLLILSQTFERGKMFNLFT